MAISDNLSNVLFFDLECVPQYSSYFDLDDGLKPLWEKKAANLWKHIGMEDASVDELYDNRSGIYADWENWLGLFSWFGVIFGQGKLLGLGEIWRFSGG